MSDQTTLYGKNNCRQGFSLVLTLRAIATELLVIEMSDQTTLYSGNNFRVSRQYELFVPLQLRSL